MVYEFKDTMALVPLLLPEGQNRIQMTLLIAVLPRSSHLSEKSCPTLKTPLLAWACLLSQSFREYCKLNYGKTFTIKNDILYNGDDAIAVLISHQ